MTPKDLYFILRKKCILFKIKLSIWSSRAAQALLHTAGMIIDSIMEGLSR